MTEPAFTRRNFGRLSLLSLAGVMVAWPAPAQDIIPVIQLTQVGCQFLEAEAGINHSYDPESSLDCEAINGRTATTRLDQAPPLELSPGRYKFRVTNYDVPYDLGFWLRAIDYDKRNLWHRLTKLNVEFSGLKLGETRTVTVQLKDGKYIYSCPFNPTPDYVLIVR